LASKFDCLTTLQLLMCYLLYCSLPAAGLLSIALRLPAFGAAPNPANRVLAGLPCYLLFAGASV